MRAVILGCGHSAGVPVIGCNCQVCSSTNPKNKRLRVSVLLQINGLNLIIDTSPDFRQQMLLQHINKLDAVLFTHDHADHTHGIDDVRSYNYMADGAIAAYGNRATMEILRQRFGYIFQPKPQSGIWFRPAIEPKILPDEPVHRFTIGDTAITAFQQQHGKVISLGYRVGNFAYSTDVDTLPERAFEALAGVETWVVDCLRYTPSFSHSHLERTLEWIARVKPKRAVLTHMAHEFDYDTLKAELPVGVEPAYDGMVIKL